MSAVKAVTVGGAIAVDSGPRGKGEIVGLNSIANGVLDAAAHDDDLVGGVRLQRLIGRDGERVIKGVGPIGGDRLTAERTNDHVAAELDGMSTDCFVDQQTDWGPDRIV